MSVAGQSVTGGAQLDEGPQELPPRRTVHLAERGSFFVRASNGAPGSTAVVLLHGLGATADLNWASAFPALSGSFRVVAPDLRGHGESAALGRFTLENAADDVAALVDSLALGPVIVVGYSMGGAVAQLVARRHPDTVRGLVLCATSRSFNDTWREHLMFAAVPPARAAARAMPDDLARTTARFIVGRVAGDLQDLPYEQPAATLDMGEVLDAAAALGDYRSHRWIGKIDIPSAVLVHLRDQLVPPHRQVALAHAMPRAVVYPVDGDHFAAVKTPSTFVATLVRALHDVNRRIRADESQPVETRAAS